MQYVKKFREGNPIQRRHHMLFTVALAALIGGACFEPISPTLRPTEIDIIELAYSDYKYPEGFYTEELNGTSFYYMNTLSITPPGEREYIRIDLSTDDRDTAFYWSILTWAGGEISIDGDSAREYVSEAETEKYFEFRWVKENNPDYIRRYRAHKSSYLDASMYDQFNPGPVLGKYRQRPFELERVQELIEYMKFIQIYQTRGFKVLESSCLEFPKEYVCTIVELQMSWGDYGLNDLIAVLNKIYTVDKATGDITEREELIQTYTGHSN